MSNTGLLFGAMSEGGSVLNGLKEDDLEDDDSENTLENGAASDTERILEKIQLRKILSSLKS